MNDVLIQTTTSAGRLKLANILIQQDDGTYFDKDGSVKNSLGVDYLKCTQWRIDPQVKANPPQKEETKVGGLAENNNLLASDHSTDFKMKTDKGI